MIGVKILVIGYLCICLILFILNFLQILKFKWYIDYYTIIDKICVSKSWSRYEIESIRYNLYCFLNNIYDIKYDDIIQNYKITYATFISFFWIFILIYYIIPVINNLYYEGEFIMPQIGLLIIIFAIVYTTVNGILEASFQKIKINMNDDNNYINKYKKMYKILNAIMMLSNILESNIEYDLDKLNEVPITLDKLIENNIGSYYNLTNISKIRHEKSKAYQNLDFVKFLILDKQSPFLLKYFKNIYVRLPDTSSYQFDFNENIYLTDLFNKFSDMVIVRNNLIEIKNLIKNHQNNNAEIYTKIYDIINTQLQSSSSDENLKEIFENINNIFQNQDNKNILVKYNANLYIDIENKLNKINEQFINKQYKEIYTDINKEIGNTLKIYEEKYSNQIIEVPENNYIKYFIDNQDIIFDTYNEKSKPYNDLINEINNVGNYIYSYLVYFVIIFLIVSHYIYINYNNNIQYSFIILSIIILYIFFILLYTNYNFAKE